MKYLTSASGGTEPARLSQGVSLWADWVHKSGPSRRCWALVHLTLDVPKPLTIFLSIQGITYGVGYGKATANFHRDSVSLRLFDPLSFRRIPLPFLWKAAVPWQRSQTQTLHVNLYLKYVRDTGIIFPPSPCRGTVLSVSRHSTL